MAQTHTVTILLDAVRQGDPAAACRLFEAVYGELRQMAAIQMAREHGPRTLQPTALVHEAYLKLFAPAHSDTSAEIRGSHSFDNHRHFFAAAAQAMRQIRIDYARRREAEKRGGRPTPPEHHRLGTGATEPAVIDDDPTDLMALDEAMKKLRQEHPELAEVVDLCYSLGLTQVRAAEILGVSRRTIQGYWDVARGLLRDMMT